MKERKIYHTHHVTSTKILNQSCHAQDMQLTTIGGLLVPPQLGGRSNVLTEDTVNLFQKKTLKIGSYL